MNRAGYSRSGEDRVSFSRVVPYTELRSTIEQPAFRAQDYRILDRVETAIRQGTQLWDWWRNADARQSYARRFDLIPSHQGEGGIYAFFDVAPVDGNPLAVMGVVQEIFFDQPRIRPGEDAAAAALWMRDQIREFALHYYHRVMKIAQPQLYPDLSEPNLPELLRNLSFWPTRGLDIAGFGARQLYYKLQDSGEVGMFPAEDRNRIVDVRAVGTKYEWVVLQLDFYEQVGLKPFGPDGPQLIGYSSDQPYVILTKDLIVNQDDPAPHLLGSYGPGYCFLAHPGSGVLAFGPDKVEPAFDAVQFNVDRSGKVIGRSIFVIPQPARIFDVPLNPLLWGLGLTSLFTLGMADPLIRPLERTVRRLPGGSLGFDPVFTGIDALNRMTGGWTERELCLSRESIYVDALYLHCTVIYEEMMAALQTWSRVPDWLDREAIPEWVRAGRLNV